MSVGLVNGNILVRLNLGDGDVDLQVDSEPKDSTFSDNRWHFIEISRDSNFVSILYFREVFL